jgi:hypothetical protein
MVASEKRERHTWAACAIENTAWEAYRGVLVLVLAPRGRSV